MLTNNATNLDQVIRPKTKMEFYPKKEYSRRLTILPNLKSDDFNINLSPVFIASVSNFTSISWHPVYLLSCGLALKCWPWNERKWPSNIDDHGANFLLLVHFTDFFKRLKIVKKLRWIELRFCMIEQFL